MLDKYDDRSYNCFMKKRDIKAKEYLIKSMEVMHKKGFHGTSIKDITDVLGIPKGSFYNYYENKIDYTIKALELFYEYMEINYYVFLRDNNLPPEERVLKVFESKIKDVADKKLEYGCFIGKLSLELSSTEESIVPIINTLHERMREGVQECLLENTNRDASKVEYISNIIMYTWQGALMRYSTSNDTKHFNNFIDHLKDLLFM